MGKGKGGGSTTTTQKVDPWAGIQPGLKQAAADTTSLYNAGGLDLKYFPNSTVAPFSNTTNTALGLTAQRALNGSQVGDSAQGAVNNALQPGFLDPGNNPYFKNALNDVSDAYARGTHASTDAAFNRSGSYGGSAYQETTQANNKAFGDSLNTLANTQYQQNRDNQLKAAALAPSLAASDYTDLNALSGVGNTLDTQNQNQLNDQINRYNFNQQAPANNIQNYIDLLNGAGGNYKTATGTTPNGGNSFASSLGGAISGAGSAANAGMGLYSLWSVLSDIRAKENVLHVGSANGFPIYNFNYKGDSIVHQGVMAQDVEQIMPDAVSTGKDGLKRVNYALIGVTPQKLH